MKHKLEPLVVGFGKPLYVLIVSLTLLSMTSSAEGSKPIFNPYNGHYYELVAEAIQWPDARAAAEKHEFQGMSGHLATVTSESENNFIVEHVMACDVNSAYVGGFQPEGSDEPGGGWRWITDELFDYNNWGPGQPDQNGGEDENVIEIKGLCSSFPYAWHDQAGDTDLFPYIVEYGAPDPHIVFNPENGHYYELVAEAVLWPDARAAAEKHEFQGMRGRLTTITSESENNFIVEQVMACDVSSAYVGGFQPAGSEEPDGGWRWVTDESFDYENWGSGQPDQYGGEDENVIEIKGICSSFPYAWHDQAGDTDYFPYIVEYSNSCQSDLNGDGIVSTSDLLILFAYWGPCGDCNSCPADLNGDCSVSTNDLLILFANWGPCP